MNTVIEMAIAQEWVKQKRDSETWEQFRERLDIVVNQHTFRRRLGEARRVNALNSQEREHTIPLKIESLDVAPPYKPDPYTRTLFTFDRDKPHILEGNWLIIGDVHAPTTDYDMAQLVSTVAQRRGVTNLLIAGDILNNDIFSVHPSEDVPIPWAREKAAARALLEEWLQVFKRIVWTAGNHERRLSKHTWGAFGMEDLRDIIIGHRSGIEVSRYGYCMINTPQGEWRITHPKRYAPSPLKTANKIAMHYACHVWSFHEHHLGVTWSDNGRHLLVNGGGLFEPSNIDYVMLDDTGMAAMVKGFGVLEDGYPILYGEAPFTNWQSVLGEGERVA